MGYFSFLCAVSGEPVRPRYPVSIFRIRNEMVTEIMTGRYDGYGAVFGPDGERWNWSSPINWIEDRFVYIRVDQFDRSKVPPEGFGGLVSIEDPEQGVGKVEDWNAHAAIVRAGETLTPVHVEIEGAYV